MCDMVWVRGGFRSRSATIADADLLRLNEINFLHDIYGYPSLLFVMMHYHASFSIL